MRNKKSRIVVLGPKGTFTEIAARKVFDSAEFRYCDTVSDVFNAVESGTEFGVVAIENSLEGSVNTTMDCLLSYDVKICKEVILDINLCIAVLPETEKTEIKTIISHPHAIAQCRKFLKENFPDAKLRIYGSTASAMKELKKLRNSAAIGPNGTARIYGLKILFENIQDSKSQTRFIVIGKKENSRNKKNFPLENFCAKSESKPSDSGKTSIIFAVKDEPGSLYSILKEFAEREINLTKIESRPSRRKLGEYVFFVDFEGNSKNKEIQEALNSVREKANFLKVLGSY